MPDRGAPFSVTITGYYTTDKDILDTHVAVSYQSVRPEKRLAELAVIQRAFDDWVVAERGLLRSQL